MKNIKIRVVTFLCIISSLFACNRNTCPNNIAVYRNVYKRKLIILTDGLHSQKLVTRLEANDAILFLQKVSGIKAKLVQGSGEFWEHASLADYKSDLKKWRKWYKYNKCTITVKYVDSVFNRNKQNYNTSIK